MDTNILNESRVGRTTVRFEVNFNDPFKNIEEIKLSCKNNKVKENVQAFSKELLDFCDKKETKTKQTAETDVLTEYSRNFIRRPFLCCFKFVG